ncbi:MAG: ATPase [Acidobacteria bacterium]|nr:ATPase [Acidobacteriota bacterium]MBW4046324.1 ATPase [Acidobacteriota bacterium]
MALFLGFDAGGTKTECALANDGHIVARARGGSIKPLRVSEEQAQENMRLLLGEIQRKSGAELREVTASCIGTAGVRLPQTQAWMKKILSQYAGGEIVVCGDEVIALDAVFPGAAGVLVMAGTGSNILARATDGSTFNVGGWGPALGDEGSGYWIGHQALRLAFRAYDFDQPSMLLERVREFWKATTLGDVVNIANQTPSPDFSQLAPLVVECAEAGDAVSREILELGGRVLGECASHAFRKLRRLEPDAAMPGIAFTGGILSGVTFVRESMMAEIRRELPNAVVHGEAADPIAGALWRARQAFTQPQAAHAAAL